MVPKEQYPEYGIDFTSDRLPRESLELLSRLLSNPEFVLTEYINPNKRALFESHLKTSLKVPATCVKSVAQKIFAGFHLS